MCLTEPHCGTDLGLIRTRAEPDGEGRYKITGTMIFIPAGEHDLSENIVHLVLAKLPAAPEGTRGISLFIVPTLRGKEDGTLGARTGVDCGSTQDTMAMKPSSSQSINFTQRPSHMVCRARRRLGKIGQD